MDEAGAKTNMTRLRGRAPRGKRLHAKAPHGHWKTTTMISSVRLDGSAQCMTIEGATDTLVFGEYVKKVLGPSLRPGDMVIMDNLRAHKSSETLALIKQIGARVRFLPAYSPDLNPIEKMWSKVKGSLRAAEARTLPELEAAIAHALQSVSAQDVQGWFQSCGLARVSPDRSDRATS